MRTQRLYSSISAALELSEVCPPILVSRLNASHDPTASELRVMGIKSTDEVFYRDMSSRWICPKRYKKITSTVVLFWVVRYLCVH